MSRPIMGLKGFAFFRTEARKACALAAASVALAGSAHCAAADDFNVVNAKGIVQEQGWTIGGTTAKGPAAGSGLAASAAEVFNPVRTVSRVANSATGTDAIAGAMEAPLLQNVLDALSAIPPVMGAPTPPQQRFIDAFGTANSAITRAAIAGAQGRFMPIPKANGSTISSTSSVGNPGVQESGLGTAEQKVDATGVKFNDSATSALNKMGQVNPAAVAYAYDRDPSLYVWSGTTPSFTFTLSQVSADPTQAASLALTAQATADARAASVFDFSASALNFDSLGSIPSALDPLQPMASPLFDLSAALLNDGGTTAWTFNFTTGSGVSFIDNYGDTTAAGLLARLNCTGGGAPGCITSLIDGVLSVTGNLALTFDLSSSAPVATALYTDDFAGSAVAAVDEPSSFAMVVVGLLGCCVAIWGRSAGFGIIAMGLSRETKSSALLKTSSEIGVLTV